MADDTPTPPRFPGGGPTETVLPDGTTIRTDKKGYVTDPEKVTQTLRKALLDTHGYVEDAPPPAPLAATGKGGS